MFTIVSHPQKTNYGLKVMLCTRIAFLYTTRELEVKWTWAESFKMNEKVELDSNFVDNESCFFDA